MTNKGYDKQRRAAYCNFEFAANQRVLPSIVADEPTSDRRRSKLSVVSVGKVVTAKQIIVIEFRFRWKRNPHFLDISMPCDSAY